MLNGTYALFSINLMKHNLARLTKSEAFCVMASMVVGPSHPPPPLRVDVLFCNISRYRGAVCYGWFMRDM